MRILYVLRHNPWGIGGGCYASRSYLEAFGEVFAGAEIDACICAEYLDDGKPDEFPSVKFKPVPERTRLQKLLSIITGELHRFQTEVIRLLDCNRYDVCIFDHNAIAGTLASTCRSRGIRTIVINHNCEQEYFRDNTAGMKRTLFLPWVRRNECRSYKNCDYNVFLTEEDKALFGHLYGASPTQGIVGGCFMRKGELPDASTLKPFHQARLKAVISGTIGNVQNLDGINYFLNELYPVMPADMEVVIAGKNPPAELEERLKCFPNMTLVANPKNMEEILGDCDLFICPTRLGGGMKLRVMDGLRAGLPVIAHQVSARGYSEFEIKGMLKSFNTIENFRKAVEEVVEGIISQKIFKRAFMEEACRMLSFDRAVEKLRIIDKNQYYVE